MRVNVTATEQIKVISLIRTPVTLIAQHSCCFDVIFLFTAAFYLEAKKLFLVLLHFPPRHPLNRLLIACNKNRHLPDEIREVRGVHEKRKAWK